MANMKLTKDKIVEELFEFITDYFDKFKCSKAEKNWWENHKYNSKKGRYGSSWSPFISTFFITFGSKQNYNIGASYTYEKGIKNFINDNLNNKYQYQKPLSRGFDVSWHNTQYEFILGMEHEETGSTIEANLQSIFEEIEKLRSYKGKFKIIVSRPRLSTTINTFPESMKYYKEEIEKKILKINCPDEEKWIVILIAPETKKLYKSHDETRILYNCYILEKKEDEKEELKLFFENSFKVTMNQNLEVIKKV